MGVQRCNLKTDSKVIASQIEKGCIARDETLERYQAAVRRVERFFKGFTVQYIKTKERRGTRASKGYNQEGGATSGCILPSCQRSLHENSRTRAKNDKCRARRRLASTDHGIPPLPLRMRQHHRVDQNARQGKAYQIIGEELYKTSVTGPLLHYLSTDEGMELLT
jgi:hypothetical protein